MFINILICFVFASTGFAAYPPVLTEVIPKELNVTDTAVYAFCAKVVSGDVVAIQVKSGAVNVKIYGIDTPDGKWGAKAKEYLAWRVERKDCAVEVVGRDNHGRANIRLYQGGADVGLQLVAMGLARAARNTDKVISLTEQAAKKRQIGMWGGK